MLAKWMSEGELTERNRYIEFLIDAFPLNDEVCKLVIERLINLLDLRYKDHFYIFQVINSFFSLKSLYLTPEGVDKLVRLISESLDYANKEIKK